LNFTTYIKKLLFSWQNSLKNLSAKEVFLLDSL